MGKTGALTAIGKAQFRDLLFGVENLGFTLSICCGAKTKVSGFCDPGSLLRHLQYRYLGVLPAGDVPLLLGIPLRRLGVCEIVGYENKYF